MSDTRQISLSLLERAIEEISHSIAALGREALASHPANKLIADLEAVKRIMACDDILAAIKRAIDGSVPYIMTHNAFLIPASSWNELAAIVSPEVRRLNELLARLDRGEKPTEAEIRDAIGWTQKEEAV